MVSFAVADSDALIALTLEKDPHHQKAVQIASKLSDQNVLVIFPVTVFPEAMTTLKRSINQPKKAHLINQQLQEGLFQIEYVNEKILEKAMQYFNQAVSKKNTMFDAIVAATADQLGTKLIFSFDGWYPKLGFKLAE
jgi:predicted nucleic acid-binding protein